MTVSRTLPSRPSLDSLRKQAKALARGRSVPLREAQLALAREYGFRGWTDLVAEVSRRLGTGLERAAAEAHAAIHRHDLDRLTQLLSEHPPLLSWTGDRDHNGLLGFATGAYGDAFGPEREAWFTRADAAELLIDAGAIVTPAVVEGILDSRAAGLLQLFQRKRLLPPSLNYSAALGGVAATGAALDHDRETFNEAFVVATNFHQQAAASVLLERSIALDVDLGTRIDSGPGRGGFVEYFIENGAFDRTQAAAIGLWKTFVMRHVKNALTGGDLPTFVSNLDRERWLLGDDLVGFQVDLIGWAATISDRGEFARALLDREPALLRRQPPPPSKSIEWAFEYGHTPLLPLLSRIWPVPDTLPCAAGLGDLRRMQAWFEEHPDTPQRVLDTALAYAISNRQFAAAELALAHGADINTNWNTHEPASLLHHAVFLEDYEIMQFLIDHGIDMTIEDYRWSSTAWGWAHYAKNDEKMADWLEQQARQRGQARPADSA